MPENESLIYDAKTASRWQPLSDRMDGGQMPNDMFGDIQDSFYFKKQERVLLVSVPSTWRRKFERGGNQSNRIATSILSHDTGNIFEYYPDTIKKIRNTVSQTKTKNRAERLKNLTGAFVVQDSEKVKGRRVILIDDVVTTGSTLKEMRDLLKDAGAKSVESFVIAH